MFFSFIRECFSWLPLPLSIIVNATITVFLIIVAVQVINSALSLPLLRHLHFLHAVPADDIDFLCRPDTLFAAGAHILPCAAALRRLCAAACLCAAVPGLSSCAWWRCPAAAPVHLDFCPPLRYDVVYQCFARLRDSPSIRWVMGDHQPPPLRFLLKALVVVGVAPAAILYPMCQIVQVYGFVYDGCNYFLDWSLQRLRAYVQLVPLLSLAFPYLGNGHMSVGSGCALDGDNWLLQLPAEPVGIDRPENLLKVARCPAGLDGVFHVCAVLSQNVLCA